MQKNLHAKTILVRVQFPPKIAPTTTVFGVARNEAVSLNLNFSRVTSKALRTVFGKTTMSAQYAAS